MPSPHPCLGTREQDQQGGEEGRSCCPHSQVRAAPGGKDKLPRTSCPAVPGNGCAKFKLLAVPSHLVQPEQPLLLLSLSPKSSPDNIGNNSGRRAWAGGRAGKSGRDKDKHSPKGSSGPKARPCRD